MNEIKKPLKKSKKPDVILPPINDVSAGSPEESPEILAAPWVLRIAGLKSEILLTGMKLPTFTTGMIR